MPPIERFEISDSLVDQMIDHVRREYPNEGCGLVAMTKDGQAVKVFPGTNTERSPTRYNMHLGEVVEAFNEMDASGWKLGAIFHSHPRSAALPSQTDLRHAYYPEALMVIISLAGDCPEIRAFQIEGPAGDCQPREVDIVIRSAGERRDMTSRNVIGILGGMGPLATADLYRKIIESTPAQTDQEHLHVVIEANPAVPDRTEALLHGGQDPTPLLLAGAQRLADAGAGFIVMPCNTAHAFLPHIEPSVSIPFVNMIEETARVAAALIGPDEKVGILATEGTIAAELYQQALLRHEMIPLVPSQSAQQQVNAAIAAVKRGQTGRESTQLALAGANELIEAGASVLLAACTELPLILRPDDVSVPLIDPTQVLADAAVRFGQGADLSLAAINEEMGRDVVSS